ncbi:MAG: hypothetical protein WB676_07690 [Bryobacteraceae bacterium]
MMKRKAFDARKEVKAIARERVGSPKPSRPIEPKTRRKKPKHKKLDIAEEESGATDRRA